MQPDREDPLPDSLAERTRQHEGLFPPSSARLELRGVREMRAHPDRASANGVSLDSTAFPEAPLTPAHLAALTFTKDYHVALYRSAIPGLRAAGRDDLVQAIEAKVAEYAGWRKWKDERDWKGAIKRFDRRWLGGVVARANRMRD